MNKEFKTILILWVISIFISWLWLYQFRNVKFKNTKDLEKANEKQEQEITAQYNELVDVYIPTITDKLPENDLPETWYITLAIPWFFENRWFYKISDKLEKEDIKLSIKKFSSYSKYESEIKSNLQKYDIALIPLNRTQWLDTENINLWENIKPYFIDIFNNILDSSTNTIIPFAIDPAITIYKKWVYEHISRKDIFSYTLLRKSQNKYQIPVLRWFDDLTFKLLENNSTPFEFFTELFVLQLKQIKINSDNQELSNMLNTNNADLKNKYTYQNLKNIVSLLSKQSEYCNDYPALCTAKYWYSDITFWFLSDLDILQTYFPGDNTINIWDFTNSNNSYPVKWRVFVVPKWNQKTNLTNKFFGEYISESIGWNETFRDNTLSAITNIYDIQKQKDKFKSMIANEKKFYLFIGSINILDQILNDWKTINMLKWNYNTDAYLSNFQY